MLSYISLDLHRESYSTIWTEKTVIKVFLNNPFLCYLKIVLQPPKNTKACLFVCPERWKAHLWTCSLVTPHRDTLKWYFWFSEKKCFLCVHVFIQKDFFSTSHNCRPKRLKSEIYAHVSGIYFLEKAIFCLKKSSKNALFMFDEKLQVTLWLVMFWCIPYDG